MLATSELALLIRQAIQRFSFRSKAKIQLACTQCEPLKNISESIAAFNWGHWKAFVFYNGTSLGGNHYPSRSTKVCLYMLRCGCCARICRLGS